MCGSFVSFVHQERSRVSSTACSPVSFVSPAQPERSSIVVPSGTCDPAKEVIFISMGRNVDMKFNIEICYIIFLILGQELSH